MTDWQGSLVQITPGTGSVSRPSPHEWVTVDDVRGELGDDVAGRTNAQILTRVDGLATDLTNSLGHGFGRCLIINSTVAGTVVVTGSELSVGGVNYAFAEYPTLGLLVSAVNSSAGTYDAELWPSIDVNTPSRLLSVQSSIVCGPTYEFRCVLSMSAAWVCAFGNNESHVFLPLPLASVLSVTENGTLLSNTQYRAVTGDRWIVRRSCTCLNACRHRGRWSCAYDGNIAVEYVPQVWGGRLPASLHQVLLESFSSREGIASMDSEGFFGFSYTSSRPKTPPWQDVLSSSAVRRYAVRYAP